MAQAVDAPFHRSRGGRIFRRRPATARPTDVFVPGHWEPRKGEPELAKALALVQSYVTEARSLLALNDEQSPERAARSEEHLRALLSSRDVDTLTSDGAWELANSLKRELLFLGDRHYVWTRLAYESEREKQPGHWHSWSEHFGSEDLDRLLKLENGTDNADAQAQAVNRLRLLYQERAEAGLERRVRAAQKCRYLAILAWALVVLFLALSAIIQDIGGGGMWESIALVGLSGALGAMLAGTFRVRDKLVELDDLRSFWPAMRVQPLVGAVSGLVILLVLESGAVALGNGQSTSWAAQGLFAFAAGFSEPFFLGVVEKVAVLPDKGNAGKDKNKR